MSDNAYSRTFTSFSGADMVVFFNGKVVGELQAVKWNKKLNDIGGGLVSGTVEAVVFDRDPMEEFEHETLQILVWLKNEWGQESFEFIKDARFTMKRSGMDIDDITSKVEYDFKANDVIVEVPLSSMTDQVKYVLENIQSEDYKARLKATAYKERLNWQFDRFVYEVVDAGEIRQLKKEREELRAALDSVLKVVDKKED